MEWHLLTPFVKEIEAEQGEGLSLTHPLIPLVCVSGWNGIHSLPSQKRGRERERESESKVMLFTHSLPLYMKVDGIASTRSFYEGEREGKGSGCHPSIHLHTPFVYESGWNGIHSLPLQKREEEQGK